jgi:hypothetical protein
VTNYVMYRCVVDGVVRYVGSGTRGRPGKHIQVVNRRLAGRGGGDKKNKLYVNLCAAIAAGADYRVEVVLTGLTQTEARAAEKAEIARYPEAQLWNTTLAEFRVRLSASARSSPKVKEQLAILHADPEFGAKVAAGLRTSPKDKAARARRAGDPEFAARVKVGWLAAMERDPEMEARRLAAQRAARLDPEMEARRLAGLRSYYARRRAGD